MKKIIGILCLFLLLVGFSQTASAVPTFSNGKNEVYYRNYETVFRDNGSGTYEELDYTDPNNPPEIAVGDIFVGIMSLQNITEQGSTVWSESAGSDELTGIFAQEVTNITVNNGGAPSLTIDLGFSSISDFTTLGGETFNTGLAANEMMKIYSDSGPGTTQFSVNTTIENDIANATNGLHWLTLGYDDSAPDNEYAWSSVTPHGTAVSDFIGKSFLGLTVLDYYFGATSILGNPLLNDPGEARYDTEVQFYANSELQGHDGFTQPNPYSEWVYASNDPAYVNNHVIPEPGTLLLFGFGLLGFSSIARRRKA